MAIYLIHRHRYWTEYLDFLLEDSERFSIVASGDAEELTYQGRSLEVFNPEKHRMIVTAGVLDDATSGNQVIYRSLHSPGFYVIPHLIGYEALCQYHPDCDFRMLMIENQYRGVITREIDHEKINEMQYALMVDPRVRPMKVDLSLYRFIEREKQAERQLGTALICMSWLVMYTPFAELEKMIRLLRRHVKVSLVVHPCVNSPHYLEAIMRLEGHLLEKIYYNLSRDEMLILYDQHEFIVTDGSGACYEAMMRGCKSLAVRNYYLRNQNDMAMPMYYDHLDDEFFPFQSYDEIANERPFSNEAFLRNMFPFLYQYTLPEAKAIAKKEILDAAEEMSR